MAARPGLDYRKDLATAIRMDASREKQLDGYLDATMEIRFAAPVSRALKKKEPPCDSPIAGDIQGRLGAMREYAGGPFPAARRRGPAVLRGSVYFDISRARPSTRR